MKGNVMEWTFTEFLIFQSIVELFIAAWIFGSAK